MKDMIKEAVLEFIRLLVFALPGIAIQVLTDNPELALGWGGLVLVSLKSLDRGAHESKDIKSDGLLPF